LLQTIHEALQKPHWPSHLGRRSCPPSVPPGSGSVVPMPLEEALRLAQPFRPRKPLWPTAPTDQRRLVLEDPEGPQARPDQPLAPFSERRFGMRRVRSLTVSVPEIPVISDAPGGPMP
jgi:CRISPR system Cascade subunit CasD